MVKKHTVLSGVIVSMVLLVVAVMQYPGGSQNDSTSDGFDWRHNYLSNLFDPVAVNGMNNTARYWAAAGTAVLSVSLALFFIQFSKKIHQQSAARVIRYAGVASMIFAFLSVTPLHDLMMRLFGALILLTFFYIAVFVLKTRRIGLTLLSILCLVLSYGCTLVYFTRAGVEYLPILQKVSLVADIIWILILDYDTTRDDFAGL